MLAKLFKQLVARRAARHDVPAGPVRPLHPPADRTQLRDEALRLYRASAHDALLEHCQLFLGKFPNDPDALQFTAAVHVARGNLGAAIDALRRAATTARNPGEVDVALGRLLAKTGAIPEAVTTLGRALSQPGTSESAGIELCTLLSALGRYDEAESGARAALSFTPGSKQLQHLLSRVLFEQGRGDESIRLLRALVAERDVAPHVHSDLLRSMNYSDTESVVTIYGEHRAWAERHADRLAGHHAQHANIREPNRRLRLGFVSPYFRKHAVTFFLESVIRALDRSRFEVVLYADVAQQDEFSARLRAYGALWRDTLKLDDAQLADLVREDRTDILIDLSGHTPGNRLLAFARRAAPVQITWNGYPNTTGMRAMDYRITDAHCDPPGTTEHLHSEQLLRLPSVYMSWTPPPDAPEVSALPAVRNGYVTYASFNACYKLSPMTLQLWSRILTESPGSRLLLAAVPAGRAQQRIETAMREAHIDPARLTFRPRVSHEAFIEMHAEADLALDPFPYHGTTTTCFSLWMGLPVISLAGTSHVSRVGVTMLTQSGLRELVAADAEDYRRIACATANDIDRLASLRTQLRAMMRSCALTDGVRCAAELQTVLREAWGRWCRTSA